MFNEDKNKHELVEILKKFEAKGFRPGCDFADDSAVGNTKINHNASKEVLGVKYRPLEETLTDMINSMLE